jgi:formylglycine-generating enzyme required for sulfatase activity
VEAVFQKALSVPPAARFARAGEFWSALEAAAKGSADAGFALGETLAMPPSSIGAVATAATQALTQPVTTQSATTLGTLSGAPTAKSNAPAIAVAALLGLGVVGGGAFFLMNRGSDAAPAASAAPADPEPSAAPSASVAGADEKKCPEGMFKIPAGQFYMGSDAADAPANQKPTHNVTLSSFCMDAYETTVEAYKSCSDRGACRRLRPEVEYENMAPKEHDAFLPACNIDADGREKHPMNCISWKDADTFCRKSNKRLPTEAEWEYATRGPDGRVFPWGDDKPTAKHLNACDVDCVKWSKKAGVGVLVLFEDASDGYAWTAPVGQYPAGRSRFGPWDVVGNVWEWVADWDGAYSADEQKNPTGPGSGDKKIIRGGGWNGAMESWLRPAHRYAAEPGRRHPAIGFRCAADL